MIQKWMQKGLRVITLQGAIEKSTILLSQYWKNGRLDGNIIISYFGGSNNIFADCIIECDGQNIKRSQTETYRYINIPPPPDNAKDVLSKPD